MKKFIQKYNYIFVSGLLGAIVFIFLYGIDIINPNEYKWLMSGGDPACHYLGWEFFRRSPWTFPIGMNTIINYPFSISVIFTDSIPLFAIFFKIFSNFLPEYFQYLGIYGLLCFILQGVFSSIVLKKFIKDNSLVIFFSLFFILSPVMIYRMYYHTALASHYLILFGIALILYKDKFNLLKTTLLWGLLGFLSASIHIYFLVFSGIALLSYMLYELLTTRKILKVILPLISYLIISALTVYLLGGFSSPVSLFGRETIGTFNFNLNAFFNAFDNYSIIIDKVPLANGLLQEEGFAYLGFGVILGITISIVALIYKFLDKLIKKEKIKTNYKAIITFVFLAILSIIIASAHRIYFGNELIIEYQLPKFIWDLVGVFRSNGRFSWTAFYILYLGCFYILYKCFNKETLLLIILLLFGIQIYDMSEIIKHKTIDISFGYEEKLTDERWEKLFNEDFEHVIFASEFDNNGDEETNIYLYAMKHKKTINRFYLAQGILNNLSEEYLGKIKHTIDDNRVYFIDRKYFMRYNEMSLNYYLLDGIYIATTLDLDYLDKISADDVVFETTREPEFKLEKNEQYIISITSNDQLEENSIEVSNVENLTFNNNTFSAVFNDVEDIRIENKNYYSLKIKITKVKNNHQIEYYCESNIEGDEIIYIDEFYEYYFKTQGNYITTGGVQMSFLDALTNRIITLNDIDKMIQEQSRCHYEKVVR